ncbi:MAG: Pirin-related protein [Oceanicaulis sp. HLUCCA04]|nr:MAG: Pirin-related protein [Oceanicaulis sp. HLUCCA04]
MSKPDIIIDGRKKDLGGFQVARVLPFAKKRMVGPFVFFDEMGPATFAPGDGIDVRPHPHIGLATVTYLFEGEMHHADSLGVSQAIQPGAVNLMIAGSGITHSERTDPQVRARGFSLHGIQTWIALPEAREEDMASFEHHAAETLPVFSEGGADIRLIIGSAYGHTAPTTMLSPTIYFHAEMAPGASLTLPGGHDELAVYLVSGDADMGGVALEPGQMGTIDGSSTTVSSRSGARVMVLGGAVIGKRFIEWNFVSSSKERLEKAKEDWRTSAAGGWDRTPFTLPPGENEYIPLPGDDLPGPPAQSKDCPTT